MLIIKNDDLYVILLSWHIRFNSFFKFQLIRNNLTNKHLNMWNQCFQFLRIKTTITSFKIEMRIFCIKSQRFHFQFFVVMIALKNICENFDRIEMFINKKRCWFKRNETNLNRKTFSSSILKIIKFLLIRI